MQRTVKTTEITYAKVSTVNGRAVTEIHTKEIHEKDKKKAIRKLLQSEKNVAIVSTRPLETLWLLDDETFFKYAQKVEPETKPETEPKAE